MSEATTATQDLPMSDPTVEEFLAAYAELTEEYGMRLKSTPIWVAGDDGTYCTALEHTVEVKP